MVSFMREEREYMKAETEAQRKETDARLEKQRQEMESKAEKQRAEMERRAEQQLHAQGTVTAHLFILPQNARAQRFYERCGWMWQHACAHDVQISGGRTYSLQVCRLEKVLGDEAADSDDGPT